MVEHPSDQREVAGSSPEVRTMTLIWRQKLGPEQCPYVVRWVVGCRWFSIRLHHWLRSDDTRHAHDHPWDFVSVVLCGSLVDRTEASDEYRGWLNVKRFQAEHRHMVVVDRPAWTLLICGPERRTWGYWVGGRFRKRNKYFHEHGHHDPCSAVIKASRNE